MMAEAESPTTPAVESPASRPERMTWTLPASAFVIALCALLLAYLAASVPASWFPAATGITWTPRDLAVTRGSGTIEGNELLITALDGSGVALISLNSGFRASDYPAIAWAAIDVPEAAEVRLLWRSDYAPQKINSVPVEVESGRLLPSILAKNPAWLGRISGLALFIRTPLSQPLRIAGAEAKPMGAMGVLTDRGREWMAPERWSGTSINTVAGGADIQGLPLPLLIAASVALAAAILWTWRWARKRSTLAALPIAVGALFAAGWLLLDARWTTNLAGQAAATQARYGGKDWREKHVAAEDGPLFTFIEKVRKQLPATPVRIFVASDANYFRSRAAYHLYPNNVFADPYQNTLPAPTQLRKGDWVVVYQRRGIQYDAAAKQLRWDGLAPVAAEIRLTDAGAALFEIQ
jgi:protein-S-isoprenylcysteine O-methyltransferase Ste14